MARIRKVGGDYSGKIGTVVLVNGKNGSYLRSLPRVNDKKSDKQLKQRSKLQQVNAFLKPIKEFLKIGFVERQMTQNAFQAATSNLLRNAFDEGDENMKLEKISVCRGSLMPPEGASVSQSEHVVIFRWNDNSSAAGAKETDKLVFLLYNIEQGKALWNVEKATRKDKYEMHLTDNDLEGTFLVYIAFINNKETEVSNSVYLGRVAFYRKTNDHD